MPLRIKKYVWDKLKSLLKSLFLAFSNIYEIQSLLSKGLLYFREIATLKNLTICQYMAKNKVEDSVIFGGLRKKPPLLAARQPERVWPFRFLTPGETSLAARREKRRLFFAG